MSVQTLESRVLVVGAGPGGLAAAVHAAEAGASVRVVDARAAAGGQIWREDSQEGAHREAAGWFARARRAGVQFSYESEVFDAISPHELWAHGPEGPQRLACESLILATGARERFLPFAGWERPRVMGVGALQALCKEGFELRGQRVVLAGSGPLLMAVGADLAARGAASTAIVEQAPRSRVWKLLPRLLRHPGKLGQAARFGMKLPPGSVRYGSWVKAASQRPDGLELALGGTSEGEEMSCDLLACAFGLVPEITLAELLGCATRLEEAQEGQARRVLVDDRQRSTVPGVFCVGEMCGIGGVECSLAEGAVAGSVAARPAAGIARLQRTVSKARAFADALGRSYALDPRLRELPSSDTSLCRCEGVSVGAAVQCGDARTARLQTRCGMGPCQARVCGPALDFLSAQRSRSAPRAPLVPTNLSDLAQSWSHQPAAKTPVA